MTRDHVGYVVLWHYLLDPSEEDCHRRLLGDFDVAVVVVFVNYVLDCCLWHLPSISLSDHLTTIPYDDRPP